MKVPYLYQFFSILSSIGRIQEIQESLVTQCDRLACHTNLVPSTCECCRTEERINISALQDDLDNKLFGQHIAKQVILHVMQNEDRIKPLVLSFHGGSGTGKTYIGQILAEHFNSMGTDSKFVHNIVAPASFYHESQVETYKDQLHALIRGNVSRCERSIFIIDDLHLMPPKLLNSLRPYLDYHDKIDGVSYRKSVFIFLSNSGGNLISDLVFELRKQGKKREEIQLLDLQSKLSSYLLNAKDSEFRDSDLINDNLIDVLVPLLPLKREHVKMCVSAELERLRRTEDEKFVSEIAEGKGMKYYRQGEDFFSLSGCKNVHVQMDLYFQQTADNSTKEHITDWGRFIK